ncbi:MAG: PliI family lysozyme inhibitor of I-type lysozyme [Pseudomonadota bacterium]
MTRRRPTAALAAALISTALALASSAGALAQSAFERSLSSLGVDFHVRCANAGSLNTLHIELRGRATHAISLEVDGVVTGAEVADLDRDGQPELYVYVASAGSGSYGTMIGVTLGSDKRLVRLRLEDIEPESPLLRGYQGRDRFEVAPDALLRRFPVYRPGDPNAAPGGGERTVRYRLGPAPGSERVLRVDRRG